MKSSKNINDYDRTTRALMMALGGLIGATALSAAVMSAVRVSADDEPTATASATASVNVPATCTMGGDGMSSHTATVNPGTWSGASGSAYEQGIGKTTLTVFCSDPEGFAIYAVGYTGNVVGGNTLVGSSATAPTIATGTATSGGTSNWSMKVDKITDSTAYMPSYMQIDNSYNAWHAVPSDYAKVAHFAATTAGQPSSTDTEKGAKLATTYAVYASSSQIADTYTGQVKYVMVHPNTKSAGTYSIKYYTSAGTQDTGLMPDETVNNYEPHTLQANAFEAPSGYEFAGWCTNNTGGAYACSGTSYADEATIPPSAMNVGSTLSLYAYWKEAGPPYMQDVATWGSTLSTGDEVIATDARDNKQYYVAKLADGNIWMTQNLDHDISSSYNYTSDNTDVSSTVTGLASTYTTGTTTWNWSYTAPGSYDPGDRCWNGTISTTSSTIDTSTVSCSSLTTEPDHYHVGNYYNWAAAVAMTDSSSYTAQNTDVNQSICPSGWRLPIGGTSSTGSKSFQYLVNQLSLTSGTSGNIQNAPVYFVYGGRWDGASADVGTHGIYWSSVVGNSYYSYQLDIGASGSLSPQGSGLRDRGASVRCVAR